jgi:hypothetical protein
MRRIGHRPERAKHPSPRAACGTPLTLFPLPGEREEGEGSWGEGILSKLAGQKPIFRAA